MKVAIIAIAKNENLYINEWIDYHFKLGFDNIIVCDNDDELILKDVIKDDRVIIEDYTKVEGVQKIAYRTSFKKYKEQYDWIFLIDIDEFLVLENHNNVKDFLSGFGEEVECIRLCYKHFTDNEELDVIDGNYNVFDRFKTEVKTKFDVLTKLFIRTTIKDELISKIYQHSINADVFAVDALNNRRYEKTMMLNNVVQKVAWVNHYRSKTIGEYIRQKYFRGGANFNGARYRTLTFFWQTNVQTPEKLAYGKKLIAEYEKRELK